MIVRVQPRLATGRLEISGRFFYLPFSIRDWRHAGYGSFSEFGPAAE